MQHSLKIKFLKGFSFFNVYVLLLPELLPCDSPSCSQWNFTIKGPLKCFEMCSIIRCVNVISTEIGRQGGTYQTAFQSPAPPQHKDPLAPPPAAEPICSHWLLPPSGSTWYYHPYGSTGLPRRIVYATDFRAISYTLSLHSVCRQCEISFRNELQMLKYV